MFTKTLLEVLRDDDFKGGYETLVAESSKRANEKRQAMTQGRFTQQPSMVQLGPVDEPFLRSQQPFSIDMPQQSTPSSDPEGRQ